MGKGTCPSRGKEISEKELTHFRHFGRDAEIQHKDVKVR